MSQENLEVVRRAYEAWSRTGDRAAFAEFSPDFEFVGVLGVTQRGIEGFQQFLDEFFAEFDDGRVEPEEYIEAGEHVLGPRE